MLDFSVTLIITVINIVFLTIILRKILFKPVNKFMAERAKRIEDTINAAQTERQQAQALLDEYRAKLKAAEGEADQIIKLARAKAEAQAERIVAEGKAAAQTLIADARQQIEAERKKAFVLFGAEMTTLVMAALSRIVQREFSSSDSRRYADMLLEEYSAVNQNKGS